MMLYSSFILLLIFAAKSPEERAHELLKKMTLNQKIHMVHGHNLNAGYAGYVSPIPELNIPALKIADGPQGVRTSWRKPGVQFCQAGIRNSKGDICCPAYCGTCGGKDCKSRTGGSYFCCAKVVRNRGNWCQNPFEDVGCVIHEATIPCFRDLTKVQGEIIKQPPVANAFECRHKCRTEEACEFWNYGDGKCYVRSGDRKETSKFVGVSGDPWCYFGYTTSFPSGLTIGASWNRSLAYLWGKTMGKEFRAKGANVALGPGVNVARIPKNGRNFEYISGEDPYLGGEMAVPAIKGMQDNGVIANVKHWINNNQETDREEINEIIDMRVQMELYVPVFEAAISKGNVGSAMCSYNKITVLRGEYNETQWACENLQVLRNELRDLLHFKGWIMSDWGASHGVELGANAGLDQEMPEAKQFGNKHLRKGVNEGTITEETIDEKVLHILTPMFEFGLFDRPPSGDVTVNTNSTEHNRIVRELASRCMVLLKNEGSLPLSKNANLIVVGDAGHIKPYTAGLGSSYVMGPHIISGLDGLHSRNPDANVLYFRTNESEQASLAAKQADAIVYFVGAMATEAFDRDNLSFDEEDLDSISVLSKVNSNVIVVISNPGAVLLPFTDKVAAILVTFFPGQEFGDSVADVLYGDVNPSGKLPMTFPNIENEQDFTQEQWPGVDGNATYSEGMIVGYRWYDQNDIAPKYEFGFGLSYTTFEVKSCKMVSSMEYSCKITNTGDVAGAEVLQLYLGFPKDGFEPPKVLKGFEKVFLNSGETQIVKFHLNERDISIFDPHIRSWKKASGEFTVYIGTSSRQIAFTSTFKSTQIDLHHSHHEIDDIDVDVFDAWTKTQLKAELKKLQKKIDILESDREMVHNPSQKIEIIPFRIRVMEFYFLPRLSHLKQHLQAQVSSEIVSFVVFLCFLFWMFFIRKFARRM